MNPHQVKAWEEVEAWLQKKGFVPTLDTVPDGRMWRSKSKRHLIVHDPIDGFYPDWLWKDLVERANEIIP